MSSEQLETHTHTSHSLPPSLPPSLPTYLRIGIQNLKGLVHLRLARSPSHVQKVGRVSALQLDDVHSGHRQARAVDHAADVAAQPNVVEVVLVRLGGGREGREGGKV